MKSSKQPPKARSKDNVMNVQKDSSPQESGTKFLSKDSVQDRQKIWLAMGGVIVVALFLGLIIQSLKEKGETEEAVLRQSLKGSTSPSLQQNKIQKETALSNRLENHENLWLHESFPSSDIPRLATPLAAKTESERSPHPENGNVVALNDKVRILEERLLILEKIHERAPHVWQTYHRLLAALSGEEPFEDELNEFKKLTSHNIKIAKAIESLEPHAKSGAPTLEKVIKSFDRVKTEIFNVYTQNLSWWERIKLQLKGLVEIKRTHGNQEAQSSPADISQQAMLDMSQKKLGQAISLLSSLKRNDTPALEAWLTHAQARQEIGKVHHFLKNQIILEMISPQ